MRVRIARDELRRIGELTQTIKALETEIARLVAQIAPQLLSEPGFGPLTAANSSARSPAPAASPQTPSSPGRPAWRRGPVSSGKTKRHRLDRGGNRQINATIHSIAVTRLRCHPETRDYIARKRSEGKSIKEASAASNATSPDVSGTSCKRPASTRIRPSTHQSLDKGAAKGRARAGPRRATTRVSSRPENGNAAPSGQVRPLRT